MGPNFQSEGVNLLLTRLQGQLNADELTFLSTLASAHTNNVYEEALDLLRKSPLNLIVIENLKFKAMNNNLIAELSALRSQYQCPSRN